MSNQFKKAVIDDVSSRSIDETYRQARAAHCIKPHV